MRKLDIVLKERVAADNARAPWTWHRARWPPAARSPASCLTGRYNPPHSSNKFIGCMHSPCITRERRERGKEARSWFQETRHRKGAASVPSSPLGRAQHGKPAPGCGPRGLACLGHGIKTAPSQACSLTTWKPNDVPAAELSAPFTSKIALKQEFAARQLLGARGREICSRAKSKVPCATTCFNQSLNVEMFEGQHLLSCGLRMISVELAMSHGMIDPRRAFHSEASQNMGVVRVVSVLAGLLSVFAPSSLATLACVFFLKACGKLLLQHLPVPGITSLKLGGKGGPNPWLPSRLFNDSRRRLTHSSNP